MSLYHTRTMSAIFYQNYQVKYTNLMYAIIVYYLHLLHISLNNFFLFFFLTMLEACDDS